MMRVVFLGDPIHVVKTSALSMERATCLHRPPSVPQQPRQTTYPCAREVVDAREVGKPFGLALFSPMPSLRARCSQ